MAPDMDCALEDALRQLAGDGLVAFPTETVWGLGARATSARAVEVLRAWKGRGDAAPISVLVTGRDGLEALEVGIDANASQLMEAFWPGPLTLVLRCRRALPNGLARSDGALGLRCSAHPVAARLAEAALAKGDGPVTATSLNRTGEAPARKRAEAAALCAGADAPYLLDLGEDAHAAPPSTVLDCTGPRPRVLRAGAVDAAALTDALGDAPLFEEASA